MTQNNKTLVLAAGFVSLCLVAPCARGEVTLTTLVSFNGTNGSDPEGGLVQGSDGNLYGTTFSGGENTNHGPYINVGYGTVFKLTPGGSFASLASFNGTNGINPTAGLVQAGDGAFYGTTWFGGSSGLGTVFRVTTNGVLTTLVSFNGVNGDSPRAALVLGNDGSLYSTTRFGGTGNNGTVFKITTNGTLTTLYSFTSDTDGREPMAPLVLGNDGNFYGQTASRSGWDIVFKMTPDGTLATLVWLNSTNGISSYAGLVQGSDGNFYGVSQAGGPQGAGGVFKVSPTGVQTTLVSFSHPDGIAFGALVEGADGNFYGVRNGTGAPDYGSVFQVTPAGAYTDLIQFDSTNGKYPRAALVQGKDGNFYGTTQWGGYGTFGTVFRLNVPSSDSPTIRTATKSANTMILAWGALPSRSYQVQFKTDFNQATWNNLGDPVTATNTLATSFDPNASDPHRFYRVALLP